MHRTGGNGLAAFTLAEVLLAAVVLAIAVTAVTMPFASAARNEQADARGTLAVGLAQEMAEEILARPFGDPDGASQPGPESGEDTRDLFDNIDDYDGYSEPAGQIATPDGVQMAGPAAVGLSRHVSVTYVYVSGQDTGESPTFARVTVEVRFDGETIATVTRLAYWLP